MKKFDENDFIRVNDAIAVTQCDDDSETEISSNALLSELGRLRISIIATGNP